MQRIGSRMHEAMSTHRVLAACTAAVVLIGAAVVAPTLSSTSSYARSDAVQPAAATGFECPVTQRSVATEPPAAGGYNYRKPGLWTPLPPDGMLRISTSVPPGPGATFGRIYADGSLTTKFPWFGSHLASNKLVINGKRLDAPAPRLHRVARNGLGGSVAQGWPHFWPGYLRFPTPGCWRVGARSRHAHRTFTISVERASA
jgi:hypothetical protein